MFHIDLAGLEPGVHRLHRDVDPDVLDAPDDASDDASPEADSGADTNPDDHPATPDDESSSVTEDVDFGLVHIDAVLNYEPGEILVTLQAQTTATMTCDRTLQRFDQPLEGSYAVLFTDPGRSAPEEGEQHDERRELPPGARHLDLTDVLRDTLLLAIPQRKVAPGAEDEEIETVFGAPEAPPDGDGPVDPRFEKLRELRNSDD